MKADLLKPSAFALKSIFSHTDIDKEIFTLLLGIHTVYTRLYHHARDNIHTVYTPASKG